uniref:DE NOVO DESIGNED PROTEIN OR135 n=1 Tax=synthetic construct TaxID=32630 RepID=UPI00024ED262|nr:Chain A, DE NOVO DESIGNED PROTEIN OR135 [synthetic construct]
MGLTRTITSQNKEELLEIALKFISQGLDLEVEFDSTDDKEIEEFERDMEDLAKKTGVQIQKQWQGNKLRIRLKGSLEHHHHHH